MEARGLYQLIRLLLFLNELIEIVSDKDYTIKNMYIR